jgi:hypothetical protein
MSIVCTVCETPARQGALGFICENDDCTSSYDFKEVADTSPRSILIECRKWQDKTYGNTYFSNRIWVDGIIWDIQEMTYGYETQYVHEAIEELISASILTAAQSSPYYIRQDGIDFYHVERFGKKSELFKKENKA